MKKVLILLLVLGVLMLGNVFATEEIAEESPEEVEFQNETNPSPCGGGEGGGSGSGGVPG